MSDRYKNLGNDIVRDTKTGLEWQADYVNRMPWQGAMDYAAGLDLGGHIDWRVPTIEESITLIDYSRANPASAFPDMPPEWFWTSSPRAALASYALVVNFNIGYVHGYDKKTNDHARCVRGKRIDTSARINELEAENEWLRKIADRALPFVVAVRDLRDDADRLSIELFHAIKGRDYPSDDEKPAG